MLEAMAQPWIVDVHSHVVPTGDDGARTIADGLALCRRAAAAGTRVLYATPHIHARWDSYPLTGERHEAFERNFPVLQRLARGIGLELRRGFEVYPGALPDGADLRRFALDGGGYLIEFPGSWTDERHPVAAVYTEAERAEQAGLTPVLAHPERCAEIVARPQLVSRFVERGWLIAPNAQSLDGRHGRDAYKTVWRLLDDGFGDLVASDAHSLQRPPELEWAYELLADRLGEARARSLLDGSALDAATPSEQAA